jgi:hypothetical protein
MVLGRRRAGRVRALVGHQARFERGDAVAMRGPRVAVVAQWSISAQMTKSVCALVHDLQSAGYQVAVCSACEADEPLVWHDPVDVDALTVIRRPNVGYDFGSWSIALELLPGVSAAENAILANDSMVGPFRSLATLLEEFEASSADVWGLTDTQQFGHHLQSYFLGFRNGALGARPLKRFWADICHEDDKTDIIHRYEIGLGQLLHAEGFVQTPAFSHELVVEPGQNPVIIGWKSLLERGFPFLKREILRSPWVAPEGETAPTVLARLLEVDIREWAEDVVVP